MTDDIRVEPLTGAAIAEALPDLSRLRIAVFREWPYLYEGTLANEQRYLEKFAAAKSSLIVAARDGESIIGVATASPLMEAVPQFAAAFRQHKLDPAKVFYFGESVLLPAYRGRGVGHAFFDAREAHARKLDGYSHSSFCGVVRPDDHPCRPNNYRPLDAFWSKRGYTKVDGLLGSFSWQDIDQTAESAKPMQFWLKAL